jgi:hypothetical protein
MQRKTISFWSVRLQFQYFDYFAAQLLNFFIVGSKLLRMACQKVSFPSLASGFIGITVFFERLIGKNSAKMCSDASIRGIDLQRGSQSFHCFLLDPVLHPFGNCFLRERRNRPASAVRDAPFAGFYVARGRNAGEKLKTTIALTPEACREALPWRHELLTPDWLEKRNRSGAKFPGEIQAHRYTSFEQVIRERAVPPILSVAIAIPERDSQTDPSGTRMRRLLDVSHSGKVALRPSEEDHE